MVGARVFELSWFLFIFLTCTRSPIHGAVKKQPRRIRRSGPNVCGGQQCCSGWQPTGQGLCIQPICNFNCGTGICVQPNVCLCENGQYNPTCTGSGTACNVRCLNGGTCRDNKCQCPQGFQGTYCENPVCSKQCLNGGQCIAPNTCACLYGFAGPQCQSDFRQGPCYKEIKDLRCQGQVSTLICTKELCCATVGKAWGSPCERCPVKPVPCAIGYLPDYESRECLDIDECKAVPGVCGENGKCSNTIGSYRCKTCDVGFKYDDVAGRCADIDECSDRQTNRCLNGRCINSVGSYTCVCRTGFVLSSDGTLCERGITPTTLLPAFRQDLCFRRLVQGSCLDAINYNVTRAECCCSDIAGAGWSAACQRCPDENTDEYNDLCLTDECSTEADDCTNGECQRTETGLRCVCNVGFFFNPSTRRCEDVNECEDGGLICENAVCINTQGNFLCECREGFAHPPSNRVKCVRISGPTPSPATSPKPPTTAGVNGCSRIGQQCENGVCARVNGILRCRCNVGFNYVDERCVDENECENGSAMCQNGLCVNEIGGYRCECAAGYLATSDRKGCIDRNECSDAQTCTNGQCTNTVGAWRCTCNSGFALSVDEKSCIDIDECNSIADVCMNGRCENTPGDYVCRCNTGYTPSTDKHMCLDTMESRCYASYSNNVCSQTLFRPLTISQCCCGKDNTAEKLRAWGNPCMACPVPQTEQYRKVCVHGSGKDSGGKDIDECSNNVGAQTDLCVNARCQNTNGDYICVCNPGYRSTANRKECVEVNECQENPSLCNRGRCENTPGSYRCVCPPGYAFDSRTRGCEDINECDNRGQCIAGTCINNMGSFRCQCPRELTLDPSGRYCEDLRKAKCWRRINNLGNCEDNVNGDVTQEVCCQTLGKAWGSPCQRCPTTERCQLGYAYKNFTCVDIDECTSFPGICRNGRCVNTLGSYQCQCSEGWTLDASRSVCLDEREAVCYQTVTRDECTKPVRGLYKKDICCCSVGAAWGRPCEECPLKDTREHDVLCRNDVGQRKRFDECNLFPGICANGECIDTSESFLCRCRPGFALDETDKNCTDINECAITPDLCGNGTCINIAGGFRCNCREGFKNAPMMMEICIDVDECADLSNPCQGGKCVNTIGSFKCECPPGKRMDASGLMCQDINECAEDLFRCQNGDCQNFMGGYQCACYVGFESSDDMKSCIDVNECAIENGRCEASCVNTIGTYRCQCPPGLRLQNDGRTCADIDECVETPEICGVGNKCQNVYAGHECECTDAYALSEDRKSCIDIDECRSNPDLCRNGVCENLFGSYRCICPEGFELDERSSVVICSDVNECASSQANICDRNAICMNTIGSYSCSCNTGYEKSVDGCQDIDECDVDNGSAERCAQNAQCINTDGSYRCECKPGYVRAADNTCQDVNECSTISNVCANGNCLNVPGTYECNCDFGYLLTNDRKGCEDLNECDAMPEFCHHGRCENIPGSFRCVCDIGFQLNRYGNNCTDTNECEVAGMCLNGRCVNEMGKYRCECDQDFQPNPTNTACIDTRTGQCALIQGPGPNSCSNLIADDVLRSKCCCSVGAAWNSPCEECPKNGTDEYKHLCPSGDGFIVDPITTSLIDIDECKFPRICVNGTCINTLGSFLCTCSRGFEYLPDVGACEDLNECELDKYICGYTGNCLNTIGSYTCECPPGEMLKDFRCVDTRPTQCFKDKQDLTDIESSTPGSSCNETLSSRPITRVECCCSQGTAYGHPEMCNLCPLRLTDEYYALCGIVQPTRPSGPGGGTPFPPGGTPGMKPITDVDECSFVKDPCGMGACMNTYGSYRCECEKGFAVKNGDPMCKDINECLLNPCVGGQCKNTFGSFMCTCSPGYIVDVTGLQCIDHNECHLNSTCVNGKCVNLVGDYRCLCNPGYQPFRGGKACSDIDECSNGNGKCRDGQCVNTPGSYSCQCNEGFREDSRHVCQDIDECAEFGTQICRNGICRNTVGGFNCQCNIGYTPDSTGRNCRDMNECVEIDGYCTNGTCTNTIGGSKCECTIGFTLSPSGDRCIDINECDEDPNLCEMDGECVNTAGSFRCICPTGYKVANYGKMCVDMRLGFCFENFDDRGCSKPRRISSNKQTCCCSKGAGWGDPCYICPQEQTNAFTLLCPKGPGYAVRNDSVDDVNECVQNPELCTNGRCINTDGSYRCQCYDGYVLDDTGRNCEDVNECAVEGICGNGTCTNTLGSYTCDCAVGFTRGRSSPSCEDINECSETRNLCAFRCVNVPGSYRCICPRFYRLHADGRHCTDVDECATGIHNCAYVCKNFFGGYKCVCPEGFRRAVVGQRCIDVNECREDASRCPNGACRNTAGSYICDCNDGYKRTSDGKSCEDLSRGLCFSQVDNGICKGSTKMMLLVTRSDCCCTAGVAWGSQCIRCPRPETAAHRRLCISNRDKLMNECNMIPDLCPNGKCIDTRDSYRCMCNQGYQLSSNGKSCVDVNECTRTPRPCRTQCINTPGSYRCTCPVGYQEISGVCQDIDECQNRSHNCPQGCQNTVGSFRCLCRPGYRWTETACADINECERQNICGFGRCVNQPGTFTCVCQRGYRYDPRTKTCVVLNKCNVGSCQGTCVNLNGGYRCGCPSGYVKHPYWNQCIDINECERQNICGFGRCINQPGTFTCVCQRGNRYDPRTKTCVVLNKCNVGSCLGTCVNLNGGYRCGCPIGYVKHPYWNQCIDVNECTTGANRCGRTKCTNIRGGYRCYCPPGFQLDRSNMLCRDTNECSRNPCSTTGCFNIRGGFQCSCPTRFYPIGGGHCISRFGQICNNCSGGQQPQRPQRIVTQNKYKFGETPQTPRSATPARYSSRLPQNTYKSSWDYYTSQSKQSNPDPYRYTYSYGTSSGQRRKRTSHFVHKLKITVPRNQTARENLLVLTPVLESLQKHFHYVILRGNRSFFAIKVEEGVSILYAKNILNVGLHRVYLKGKLDITKLKAAFETENQIEFTGSGDEKKAPEKSKKSEIFLNDAVGVSEARKFHLDVSLIVE